MSPWTAESGSSRWMPLAGEGRVLVFCRVCETKRHRQRLRKRHAQVAGPPSKADRVGFDQISSGAIVRVAGFRRIPVEDPLWGLLELACGAAGTTRPASNRAAAGQHRLRDVVSSRCCFYAVGRDLQSVTNCRTRCPRVPPPGERTPASIPVCNWKDGAMNGSEQTSARRR